MKGLRVVEIIRVDGMYVGDEYGGRSVTGTRT